MSRKTVFVSGRFNVLHPGHLRLLRYAKQCGDYLIVAVESDEMAGGTTLVHQQLRLEGVQSNSYVNEAFITDQPIPKTIEQLRPDIVVKGKEHENLDNPELLILEKYGGKLIFSSGETIFSSVDLIRREFTEATVKSIHLPFEYLARHNISSAHLLQRINQFSALRVCVIGDLIVDEYITCQPLGMSQEDPTIVVTPIDSTCFIGGAGIVAGHAAGLGARVSFITVTGEDAIKDFATQELFKSNIQAYLHIDENRPTTLKQRYRCNGKSLLKVSKLSQNPISTLLQNKILTSLDTVLKQGIDLLVFSDFNYGALPQSLVDEITHRVKEYNILIAADSQSSSQIGDISRFKNMDLITPTEREARVSTRNHQDGLVVLAESLRVQSMAKNILLKMGEEGLLIHSIKDNMLDKWFTDRVDALNSSPKDVAGAGDSLLIASALTLACGGDIWEAALLGSLAAAIQVGRIGNTPIQARELLQELTQ